MFIFGTFDASATPGLSAVLADWPTAAAPDVATVEAPGKDGAFFAQAALGEGQWRYLLHAEAVTPMAVLAITSTVARHCNPLLGVQPLSVDVAAGWQWHAVAASEIRWSRGKWKPGSECHMEAELTFQTPDPYGYANPDEQWMWTTPGTRTVTRDKGDAPSYPTIEVEAALTSAQSVTLTINGTAVKVDGPLQAGRVLRLDYQMMDFGIWSGDTKVSSAVPQMRSYARIELPVGPSTATIATNGALSALRIKANSRRL